MPAYAHGTVTVGTSAVLLVAGVYVAGGLMVQNNGTGKIYLGGPTVTAGTTATGGLMLPTGTSVEVPTSSDLSRDLWAIGDTAAQPVTYLLA